MNVYTLQSAASTHANSHKDCTLNYMGTLLERGNGYSEDGNLVFLLEIRYL